MKDKYRTRNFMFTLNNPEITGKELIEKAKVIGSIRYLIFQREQGKTREIPHYQGYIECYRLESYTRLNKILFNGQAYLQRRMGTQVEAIRYVTKTDSKISETHEYGKKRRLYEITNPKNPDIPKNREEQ